MGGKERLSSHLLVHVPGGSQESKSRHPTGVAATQAFEQLPTASQGAGIRAGFKPRVSYTQAQVPGMGWGLCTVEPNTHLQ